MLLLGSHRYNELGVYGRLRLCFRHFFTMCFRHIAVLCRRWCSFNHVLSSNAAILRLVFDLFVFRELVIDVKRLVSSSHEET